jgi:hypothetical protein
MQNASGVGRLLLYTMAVGIKVTSGSFSTFRLWSFTAASV